MTLQASPALPRPSKSRAAAIKAGSPTPQHAIMELKHRILTALGKLADRDTQQIAVDELDKVVDTLSADCVSVCLSCLYDSEMQQKSVVKKECVRLFGSLASTHGDLITPHLPKIIGSIMRRLRDPDSSVRDACVDVMGVLSSRMISSPPSPSSPIQENGAQNASSSTSTPALALATFSKPLFDALSEQNKSVQTGAAMSLARVIESAKDPPLGAMSRLCPRICKFMSNPNFVARPALLAVIGSLSQVGALGQAQLTMVMPCVHEALENSDWATRKAAAETLGHISTNPGYSLASFRELTLSNLESCRFDKVKPVRDSVLDAIQLWKSLPGTEVETSGVASKNDGPEITNTTEKSLSPTPSEKSLGAGGSPGNGKKLQVTAEIRPSRLPKLSPEKPSAAIKKRSPALTDKKVNPDFFQKLSARNTDDWDIQVAVPRKGSLPMVGAPQVDAKNADVKEVAMQKCPERSLSSAEQLFQGVERYTAGNCLVSDDEGECLHKDVLLNDRSLTLSNEKRQMFKMSQVKGETILGDRVLKKDVAYEDWEGREHRRGSSNVDASKESTDFNETINVHSIQKQLFQLDQQQLSLLQMVQEFIVSSQETMSALQSRVRQLENIVEEMACDPDVSTRRATNGSVIEMPSGERIVGSGFTNPDSGRNVHPVSDREPASEHMSARAGAVRNSLYKIPSDPPDEWNDYTFGNPRSRSAGAYMFDSGPLSQQRSNGGPGDLPTEDSRVERTVMRRVWDKVAQPGLGRRGEGPSARSVWQASKDEETLAAIRVAGEDVEISDVEAQLANLHSASGRALHNFDGQVKSQWSQWSSILEFVLAGDMESAYTEVLCTEDVIMLVKLMSKTGPVLDQLTANTASEVLHAVAQLLQQQNYVDFCVAWIQQVADMVVNDGADCLEISEDAKKELLLGLQESMGTNMLDDCSGTSVEQVLQLLMDAWSFNSELCGTQL
eukprot:c12265_g1_i1 orf=1180-4047(-)